MARELVAHVRKVTDKPIRHVLLTHYHAVRVLGASGYEERVNVIASDATRGMIEERGRQDAGRAPVRAVPPPRSAGAESRGRARAGVGAGPMSKLIRSPNLRDPDGDRKSVV